MVEITPRTTAFYGDDNVPVNCVSMYRHPPWIKQVVKGMFVRFLDPLSFNTSEYVNPTPVNLVLEGLRAGTPIPATLTGLGSDNQRLNGSSVLLVAVIDETFYRIRVVVDGIKRIFKVRKENLEIPEIYKGDWYRPTKLYFALQCYQLQHKSQEGYVFSGDILADSGGNNTVRLSMEICYRSSTEFIFQDENVYAAEAAEHARKRKDTKTKIKELVSRPITDIAVGFVCRELSRALMTGSVASHVDDYCANRPYIKQAVDCMSSACKADRDDVKCLLERLAFIVACIELDKKDSEQIFLGRLRAERYAPEVLCSLQVEEMAPRVYMDTATEPSILRTFEQNLVEVRKNLLRTYEERFYGYVNPYDALRTNPQEWHHTPYLVSIDPWLEKCAELKEQGVDPSSVVYYKPSDGTGPQCFVIDDILNGKVRVDGRAPEFIRFVEVINDIYGPMVRFRRSKPSQETDRVRVDTDPAQRTAVLALLQKAGLESWQRVGLPRVPELLAEYKDNYDELWRLLKEKFGEAAIPPSLPKAIIAPDLLDKIRAKLLSLQPTLSATERDTGQELLNRSSLVHGSRPTSDAEEAMLTSGSTVDDWEDLVSDDTAPSTPREEPLGAGSTESDLVETTVDATNRARETALELGVDITQVKPGKEDFISTADVLRHAGSTSAAKQRPPALKETVPIPPVSPPQRRPSVKKDSVWRMPGFVPSSPGAPKTPSNQARHAVFSQPISESATAEEYQEESGRIPPSGGFKPPGISKRKKKSSNPATESPRCSKCNADCAYRRITFPKMENGRISMLHFCGRGCAERATQFESS